jgi:hypothetical protein
VVAACEAADISNKPSYYRELFTQVSPGDFQAGRITRNVPVRGDFSTRNATDRLLRPFNDTEKVRFLQAGRESLDKKSVIGAEKSEFYT